MSQSINLKVPLRIFGGDGTTLFQGSGIFGLVYIGKVTTATINLHDGVVFNTTTATMNASVAAGADIPVQDLNVRPSNTTGAADKGWLGTSLTTGITLGNECAIAGPGSLWFGRVAGVIVLGDSAAAHATTNGLLVSTSTVPSTPAWACGVWIKQSGTSGGFTDTGSATAAGIMVAPHAIS